MPVGSLNSGGFVSISIVTWKGGQYETIPYKQAFGGVPREAKMEHKSNKQTKAQAHRFVNAAEIDTYRPIVNNPDIHHSLEDTILDSVFLVVFSDVGDEVVVEFFALLCRRRFVEIRLVAFLG